MYLIVLPWDMRIPNQALSGNFQLLISGQNKFHHSEQKFPPGGKSIEGYTYWFHSADAV